MSGPKHTAGPWEWDSGIIPPDGPGRYSDIYTDGGDLIIASVNELRETAPAVGAANARLIAAAPRMFDYIAARAEQGDAEALQIMGGFDADS